MAVACFMQVLSGQATDRLSFAYKLRSPENLVLNQHHKLSASSKDSGYATPDLHCLALPDLLQGMISMFTLPHQDCLACRCLGKMTAGELTRRFDLSHMSINDALTVCVDDFPLLAP